MKVVETLSVGDRMRFSAELIKQIQDDELGRVPQVVTVVKIEEEADGLKVVWLQVVE